MERNAPQKLAERPGVALESLERLIADYHDPSGRLRIVATPRFAISCTFDYLKKIAAVAEKHELLIQTHLSENLKEIEETRRLFPGFKDYTDVYEQSGLLGQRTLLGHGIYLSDNELERLSNLKAAIIHCPTSNAFLQSGIFGVRKAWDRGVRTGIGTDIGAGYSLSMFNEMKNAVEASKYYALLVADFPALTPAEVFYMATLGNAKIIGLDNQIGSIEAGKQATFLVLDHCFGDWYSSPHDLLSGLIYSNEKQTIKEFWIDGKNKFLDIRDIKL
jgi:guanine deaminase